MREKSHHFYLMNLTDTDPTLEPRICHLRFDFSHSVFFTVQKPVIRSKKLSGLTFIMESSGEDLKT